MDTQGMMGVMGAMAVGLAVVTVVMAAMVRQAVMVDGLVVVMVGTAVMAMMRQAVMVDGLVVVMVGTAVMGNLVVLADGLAVAMAVMVEITPVHTLTIQTTAAMTCRVE